jgi:hypothetical protein
VRQKCNISAPETRRVIRSISLASKSENLTVFQRLAAHKCTGTRIPAERAVRSLPTCTRSALAPVPASSGVAARRPGARLPPLHSRRRRKGGPSRPDETIFPEREVVPQQSRSTVRFVQQRGSIMLALILNAIYRQFLKATLPGMRRHQ